MLWRSVAVGDPEMLIHIQRQRGDVIGIPSGQKPVSQPALRWSRDRQTFRDVHDYVLQAPPEPGHHLVSVVTGFLRVSSCANSASFDMSTFSTRNVSARRGSKISHHQARRHAARTRNRSTCRRRPSCQKDYTKTSGDEPRDGGDRSAEACRTSRYISERSAGRGLQRSAGLRHRFWTKGCNTSPRLALDVNQHFRSPNSDQTPTTFTHAQPGVEPGVEQSQRGLLRSLDYPGKAEEVASGT